MGTKRARSSSRRLIGALTSVAVVAAGLTGLSTATESYSANAAIPAGWDAGNIIDDGAFFNGRSMSVSDIQSFIDSQVTCAEGAVCLANYTETTTDIPATPMCSTYRGVANESAATIIYHTAITCGISAQTILVILQKEQGLVTKTAPSVSALSRAMGAGCPDTSGCDVNYLTFAKQVHYGAYLLKRYTQPTGTGPDTPYTTNFAARYPVGEFSNVLYNVSTRCTSTSRIFIANQATHALYIYTPYTPNAASLAAWPNAVPASDPEGSTCASYGNRNFYGFYSSWFGTGRGSISGTVTGEGFGPMADTWVRAFTDSGTLAGASLTTSAGAYLITGLEPGRYTMQFDGNATVVGQWWGDARGQSSATYIDVSQTDIIAGKNVVLKNPSFADAADPWSAFYPYIEWMASTGISTGTPQPDGAPLYKPLDSVSRQAMAQFLFRISGETFAAPAEPSFADVPPTASFYTAIEWLASEGISTGTAQQEGKPFFNPSAPVSRQVMAVFLARFSGADVVTPPSSQSFCDVPTSSTFAPAIFFMADNSISEGTPTPGCLPLFKPTEPVSRQAMAAFFFRLALVR